MSGSRKTGRHYTGPKTKNDSAGILRATILHQLGLDHEKLTYRYDGRDFRLTDVHGSVVHDILS